jgi:hypothetical protein
MRTLEVRCDNCGMTQTEKTEADAAWLNSQIAAGGVKVAAGGAEFGPEPARLHRPLFWLTLEDVGIAQRSGALDFCSHKCLAEWCADAEVREAFAHDYGDERSPREVE